MSYCYSEPNAWYLWRVNVCMTTIRDVVSMTPILVTQLTDEQC